MCGRFTLTLDPGDLREELDLGPIAVELYARFNIAPTQPVAVVTEADKRQVELFKWGLIPSWTKDPTIGSRLINARSETLAEKPSFRKAFERRRCLILADGFFEWAHAIEKTARKTPYYFHLVSGKAFTFAGLWEFWRSPSGEEIRSCTIITCPANERIAAFHDRMPVILPEAVRWKWLDPAAKPASLNSFLVPYPAGEIAYHPVSTMVNSPTVDDPACVLPVQ
jgi:putative SOS response-associated peptidase YedK